MKILNQLAIILGLWALGEYISSFIQSVVVIPGSIIGMILLFILLKAKVIKLESINEVSNFFLDNMAIFFIPSGVSLIKSLDLISDNIFDTEIFGIILTILFYNIGIYIQKKTKKPIFNPLLIAILCIILFLSITKIPYESYKLGADRINFFLSPVTIVLAVPLYKQFDLFKKYLLEILIGISCGVVASFISVKLIGYFTNANLDIINSLIPKSITTPMGISLTKTLNGVEAITVVSIILTGILGAIMSSIVFKIGKINHPVAKGIALGTSAHALGTTKALEMGEVEGAMSGLSIGISGIITVILIPIIIKFL